MDLFVILSGVKYLDMCILVLKQSLLLHCQWSFRCLINLEWIQSFLSNWHFKTDSLWFEIFGTLIDIGCIIINLCNYNASILWQKILVLNKENSIFDIRFKEYSLFLLLRNLTPFFIFVSPITFILFPSPWIPQLK